MADPVVPFAVKLVGTVCAEEKSSFRIETHLDPDRPYPSFLWDLRLLETNERRMRNIGLGRLVPRNMIHQDLCYAAERFCEECRLMARTAAWCF